MKSHRIIFLLIFLSILFSNTLAQPLAVCFEEGTPQEVVNYVTARE